MININAHDEFSSPKLGLVVERLPSLADEKHGVTMIKINNKKLSLLFFAGFVVVGIKLTASPAAKKDTAFAVIIIKELA